MYYMPYKSDFALGRVTNEKTRNKSLLLKRYFYHEKVFVGLRQSQYETDQTFNMQCEVCVNHLQQCYVGSDVMLVATISRLKIT